MASGFGVSGAAGTGLAIAAQVATYTLTRSTDPWTQAGEVLIAGFTTQFVADWATGFFNDLKSGSIAQQYYEQFGL